MKEYSKNEKKAICDALNALVWKCSHDHATWLKVIAPAVLSRAMHVDVTWDEDAQEFRCQ